MCKANIFHDFVYAPTESQRAATAGSAEDRETAAPDQVAHDIQQRARGNTQTTPCCFQVPPLLPDIERPEPIAFHSPEDEAVGNGSRPPPTISPTGHGNAQARFVLDGLSRGVVAAVLSPSYRSEQRRAFGESRSVDASPQGRRGTEVLAFVASERTRSPIEDLEIPSSIPLPSGVVDRMPLEEPGQMSQGLSSAFGSNIADRTPFGEPVSPFGRTGLSGFTPARTRTRAVDDARHVNLHAVVSED
jgi:hypothetical protein